MPSTPKKTALAITRKGGHYGLALKGNQPSLYARARQKIGLQKILGQAPAWQSESEAGHGRIEKRTLRASANMIAKKVNSPACDKSEP